MVDLREEEPQTILNFESHLTISLRYVGVQIYFLLCNFFIRIVERTIIIHKQRVFDCNNTNESVFLNSPTPSF